MTAIDTWIADIKQNKFSDLPSPMVTTAAIAIAALTFISTGGVAPVTSVFGRVGAVVAAANDYNFNQLAGTLGATQMGALTGDVTSAGGTFATTVAAIGGITVSGTTGTGNVVFSSQPTFAGPSLVVDGSFLTVTGTWNAGAQAFSGALKVNVTNTASQGTSKLIDLQVGGASQFSVDRTGVGTIANGLTVTAGDLTLPAANTLFFVGRASIKSTTSGINCRGSTGVADTFVTGTDFQSSSGLLAKSQATVNYSNNAGAQAATITNGPTAGNPTKWIPINDNGTTRNIPAW